MNGTRKIPLTQGQFVLVDEAEELAKGEADGDPEYECDATEIFPK